MYKYFFVCIQLLYIVKVSAQDSTMVQQKQIDTVAAKKWVVAVDAFSRYIWRGQAYGGNFPTIQPSFDYHVTDNLKVGIWATTNLKYDYYYSDNVTPNYAHQELDVWVSYQITDYMAISVWDYYWPSWHSIEGEDNNYFNYGVDGVKTVDASLEFDFSDGFKYPFNGIISTLILGNDFRYNGEGGNPRQNFTTYAELGYAFYDIFGLLTQSKVARNIDLYPSIGAVLNNQAGYYEAAGSKGVSFVNMALSANREFALGQGVTIPVSLNYTHNASRRNTEIDGRDFVTLGVSVYY